MAHQDAAWQVTSLHCSLQQAIRFSVPALRDPLNSPHVSSSDLRPFLQGIPAGPLLSPRHFLNQCCFFILTLQLGFHSCGVCQLWMCLLSNPVLYSPQGRCRETNRCDGKCLFGCNDEILLHPLEPQLYSFDPLILVFSVFSQKRTLPHLRVECKLENPVVVVF